MSASSNALVIASVLDEAFKVFRARLNNLSSSRILVRLLLAIAIPPNRYYQSSNTVIPVQTVNGQTKMRRFTFQAQLGR
jgi:hypothetical protein